MKRSTVRTNFSTLHRIAFFPFSFLFFEEVVHFRVRFHREGIPAADRHRLGSSRNGNDAWTTTKERLHRNARVAAYRQASVGISRGYHGFSIASFLSLFLGHTENNGTRYAKRRLVSFCSTRARARPSCRRWLIAIGELIGCHCNFIVPRPAFPLPCH